MIITKNSLNDADATTNMSIAAIPAISLRRKWRQLGEGLPPLRHMYLATVAWLTSTPSFNSSPWTRGAPQSGLALLTCRVSARCAYRKPCPGRPPKGHGVLMLNWKPSGLKAVTVAVPLLGNPPLAPATV
jgi:hypothetical protein